MDEKKVKFNKTTGEVKEWDSGAFKYDDILAHEGSFALLQKVLLPAFAAHGITSDDQIIREIGRILTNRTGAALVTQEYQRRDNIVKAGNANAGSMGIQQSSDAAANTLDGQIKILSKQWQTFEQKIGSVLVPELTEILKGLESFFTYMGRLVGGVVKEYIKAEDFMAKYNFGNDSRPLDEKRPDGAILGWLKNKGLGGPTSSPTGSAATTVKTGDTTINLTIDGQELAHKTSKIIAGGMSLPSSGSSSDSRMTLPPVN